MDGPHRQQGKQQGRGAFQIGERSVAQRQRLEGGVRGMRFFNSLPKLLNPGAAPRRAFGQGRPVQLAIHEGYARAFATIADSNITSFITAFILFMVGTGAVKGFALVLMIGLATSMFTTVTACRAVVNIIWGGRQNLKKLSI